MFGPCADDAIDGAAVSVAVLLFGEHGASEATMGSRDDDRARLGGLAATARLTAAIPGAPRGDGAVNSARAGIAHRTFLYSRACDATVGHGGGHKASAGLGAATAHDGTKAEASPFADNTVDGAVVGVAVHVFRHVRACNTTVGLSDNHGTGMRDLATSASLRAGAPRAPG